MELNLSDVKPKRQDRPSPAQEAAGMRRIIELYQIEIVKKRTK